jgi:type II secretory pathway pseudopilin PulG
MLPNVLHSNDLFLLTCRRTPLGSRRRSARGFTLAEVGLATAILLLMGLLFGTAVPSILHTPQFSNNYTQAGELAQHKIDEMRGAGYNTLIQASQIQSMGIIDSENANGTYDFTTADNLGNFFPAGSTGTITLAADPNTPANTLLDATVTIVWTRGITPGGTYTTRSVISR